MEDDDETETFGLLPHKLYQKYVQEARKPLGWDRPR